MGENMVISSSELKVEWRIQDHYCISLYEIWLEESKLMDSKSIYHFFPIDLSSVSIWFMAIGLIQHNKSTGRHTVVAMIVRWGKAAEH